MFDIGIGEILALGVIGLLVFGPERLPRAAADAGKWIRQIRAMAISARKDLTDSAGIDMTETMDSVKELRDLHPRNIAATFFKDDEPDPKSPPRAQPKPSSGTSDKPGPSYDPDLT